MPRATFQKVFRSKKPRGKGKFIFGQTLFFFLWKNHYCW